MGVRRSAQQEQLADLDLLTSAQAINVNTSGHSYSSVVAVRPNGPYSARLRASRVRGGRPFGR